MEIDFWNSWENPIGVFGFVIAIVFIGSFFSYMKQRSKNELIREALRSGQSLDPELLGDLKDDDSEGGLIVAGLIVMAVAVGLVIMGYQIDKVEGKDEVFQIMKGVAAIPGLIGLVLFVAGVFQALTRKKKD